MKNKFFKDGHGTHKLRAIENILNFHPTLPCILIGDSGEQDPEIYSEVVKDFPNRVEAIYIRDASGNARDETVREARSHLRARQRPAFAGRADLRSRARCPQAGIHRFCTTFFSISDSSRLLIHAAAQ